MSKGLAITALVLAIVGFFVPAITVYWVWLTIVIASVSIISGDEGKGLSIAAWIVSIINLLFLSPLFWAAVKGESLGGGSVLVTITFVIFLLPIVAMVMRSRTNKASAASD